MTVGTGSQPPDFGAIGNGQTPSASATRLAEAEAKNLMGPKKVRTTIHTLTIIVLWFGAAILLCIFAVRAWHLIGPMSWRWLPAEELQSIDKMLFSSAFGGIVIKYIGDILFDKKSP
ncbi:hypothetical protein ACFIQG_20415 [Comamonas odontotermitis]|uniref:hypothetical protein n=1 Tax=Comamonas odontotermitis TaxID=379895 RepID=UPI00366B027C